MNVHIHGRVSGTKIGIALIAFLLGSTIGHSLLTSIAALAEEEGTIQISQIGELSAEWSLASRGEPMTSSSAETSLQRPAGNYSLVITPPPGFKTVTLIEENGTAVRSSDSRTVSGQLVAGGTLTFRIQIQPDPEDRGMISVTSEPPGMPALLRTPLGEKRIRTPYSDRSAPAGNYSVQFEPQECPSPPPLSRKLVGKGREVMHINMDISRCKDGTYLRSLEQEQPRRLPTRQSSRSKGDENPEIIPCHPSRVPERSTLTTEEAVSEARLQRRDTRLEQRLLERALSSDAIGTESSGNSRVGPPPPRRRD